MAIAGIKILSTVNMNRRNMLILAVSFGMGLGVLLVPQFAGALASNIGGTFGKLMGSIFSSAITTGGLTVLILSAIMVKSKKTSWTHLIKRVVYPPFFIDSVIWL